MEFNMFKQNKKNNDALTFDAVNLADYGPAGVSISTWNKMSKEQQAEMKKTATKILIAGAIAAFGAYVLYNRYKNKPVQSKTIGFFKVVYNKINNTTSRVSIFQLDDNRMVYSKELPIEEAAALYTAINNTTAIKGIVEPQVEEPKRIEPANRGLM